MLARFDRRARQDDTVDRTLDQPLDPLGDRQIGFAGAGRAFAENQFDVIDGAKVVGLP